MTCLRRLILSDDGFGVFESVLLSLDAALFISELDHGYYWLGAY